MTDNGDVRRPAKNRILVAGWFSFEGMGATAGDVMVKDVACNWLGDAGLRYDVATARPFRDGVDWQTVDPTRYSHVLFVCGPFGNGEPLTDFLPRFRHCRLVGLNLTMVEPLEVWNPFFELFERDSSRSARPDVSLLASATRVPVIGRILRDPEGTHGGGQQEAANEAIERLLASVDGACIDIDTALDRNRTGLRTAAEVVAVIAKMDVVVTTRLHGLVLALKSGVPVVAIDPVPGGGKIARQAGVLGWSPVFTVDHLDDLKLRESFDGALTDDARSTARRAARAGAESLRELPREVIASLTDA